jgi:hypothetical protein
MRTMLQRCVEYLLEHRDDFACFVTDEQTYEQVCGLPS